MITIFPSCRNDDTCDRYAVERPSPMVVKPSGKLMLARLVQQKNAWAFMVVILSGRTTPVIVVFSWKACAPISLTGMLFFNRGYPCRNDYAFKLFVRQFVSNRRHSRFFSKKLLPLKHFQGADRECFGIRHLLVSATSLWGLQR